MISWKQLSPFLRLTIAVPWCLLLAVFALAAEPAYDALQVNRTTRQPSDATPLNLNSANVTGPLDWAKLGGKPTTLTGYGITDAQPLDSDLSAIAVLSTTAWGRAILALADAGTARTYLGTNDAGNLSTGTLSNARLPGNVPRLSDDDSLTIAGALDVVTINANGPIHAYDGIDGDGSNLTGVHADTSTAPDP